MDYPLFSFPNLDIESKTRRQALSSSWRPDIALVATPPPHWCGPSLQAKPCSNLPEVLKPSEDPGRALKRLLATWSLTDVGQIPGFLLAAVVVIKKLDQKVWQQRVKGGDGGLPPPPVTNRCHTSKQKTVSTSSSAVRQTIRAHKRGLQLLSATSLLMIDPKPVSHNS